jgi:methionyl aminopeptidase
MSIIKTSEEVQKLRNVCKATALVLKKLIRDTHIGDTGLEINNRAIHLFKDMNIEPVFHGYQGFPAMMCISKNDGIIHGIPDGEPFQNGDVIKYDIGGRLDGYCADTARTFILGNIRDKKHEELVKHTRKAVDNTIHRIREGFTLKNIAEEIETYAEIHGLGNVTAYAGHGIGTELHELPTIQFCSTKVIENIILKEGMVFTIEPMFTLGSGNIRQSGHWNVKTEDGSIAAHIEEVILVKKYGNEILTK